ncbi:hypothetical protein, partial [Tenacibaculum maritimum]|uniref:hypothetical protein n=1 Tax=Tenacibaculum maritimum TaxID=107401 RepID=UPI003875D62C
MKERGSEWNKWDLHIHSPYSLGTSNKYNGITIKEFCEKIKEKEIKVIGLTNYFIVLEKEYKEIKENLGNECLVIPNFEFRVRDKNKKGQYINLHILFNPKIPISDIHKALARVDLCNEESRYCNLDDIKAVGLESTYVELGSLLTEINKDFNEIDDFVIATPYYGYGGFRQDNKPRSIKMEMKYDKKTHLILGNNSAKDVFSKDRIYELKDDDDNVINYIETKVKPTIKCSDAHELEKIGDYTWVKAKLTFEGLKQIIYEPEIRCRISGENPDKKLAHKCIESVQFIGAESEFTDKVIHFSNDLNTIIGGKSSGKSLLLHYLANTINYKYALKQQFTNSNLLKEYILNCYDKYGFSKKEDFEFKIKWNDGVVYKFSERQTVKDRNVVYIPQSYILSLTENIEKKSRKILGKFIRDILLQEPESNSSYGEFIDNVKKLDELRDNSIDEYFRIESEIIKLNRKKREIGDKKGIENFINTQVKVIEDLKKKSNISEEDLKLYSNLKANI